MDLQNILFGQAGIAVIVAGVVGWVKMTWKQASKALYMGVAIVGSLGAGAIAFPIYSLDWNWLMWLGLSAMTLGFQLLEQNEAWPKIKEFGLWILEFFFNKKK